MRIDVLMDCPIGARYYEATLAAIERCDHPFFVGTLCQPPLRSTPEAPHPVWLGFVDAVTSGISHDGPRRRST